MTKEIDQPTDETEAQTPAGAPAEDQVAGVDENGQEEPQESEDVKNDNKWKAENTKKSQELAEEKRRLQAERNAVENEKRLIEERKANEAYEKSLEYMDPEERARAVHQHNLEVENQKLKHQLQHHETQRAIKSTEDEMHNAASAAIKAHGLPDHLHGRILKELKHDFYLEAAPKGQAASFDFKSSAHDIGKSYKKDFAPIEKAPKLPVVQGPGGTPRPKDSSRNESNKEVAKKWFGRLKD